MSLGLNISSLKSFNFCFDETRKNDIITYINSYHRRTFMEILEVYSNNHKIKLYTNSVQNPKKIVLCLHGFNGDLWGDEFSKFRKLLAKEDEIFVCSFDSAGHGMSEVDSLNMTLDLVLQEITDVVNYLENKFKHTPLYFYGTSYGGYRAMVAISKYNYKNLKGIVLVNPAIKC